MKKILLLNPPSQKHKYSRDYYCSKTLKGSYIEHPIDLLILSGILYTRFELEILDATVQNLNRTQCLIEIKKISPDVVIFLSGSASWIEDFQFMKNFKDEINNEITLIGIGDIFREINVFCRNEWLDAVLLDFTTEDIINYIDKKYNKTKNVLFRSQGEITCKNLVEYHKEEFEIPVPRHELFIDKQYSFPFARSLPFATVLSDYGCGFNCTYCIYSSLGYKFRKTENVLEEMDYINCLGIRELFIKDQTFGFNQHRAIQLCEEMINRNYRFSWTAFSRAEIINYDLLSAMKSAGCHTLIIGVETGNIDLLKKYKNGASLEATERAFELCRKLKINTVGTFILGFPYESKESILGTINFAKKLKSDFAAFNVFVPKPKTRAKNKFFENNNDLFSKSQFDQSGISSISGNGKLSAEEIKRLLNYAKCSFYLRPSYILYRLVNIGNISEFKMLIKNFFGMMNNIINP